MSKGCVTSNTDSRLPHAHQIVAVIENAGYKLVQLNVGPMVTKYSLSRPKVITEPTVHVNATMIFVAVELATKLPENVFLQNG